VTGGGGELTKIVAPTARRPTELGGLTAGNGRRGVDEHRAISARAKVQILDTNSIKIYIL
jgi:hypothetical protein